MKERDHDIAIDNHGTIVLLWATSQRGCSWLKHNTADDATWWGGHGTYGALVCEPRYVGDIVQGALADGLGVK